VTVKCLFCRKRYQGAGAYETHLQSAHANLNIVRVSGIQNSLADVLTDWGTNLSGANDSIEHSDSDYKSDPAGHTTGSECDPRDDTLMREPETEVREDHTYPVAAEDEDYRGVGEASGEVKEYKEECRNLCGNPCAPFAAVEGFNHRSWFIESKVAKRRIHAYFANGIGN